MAFKAGHVGLDLQYGKTKVMSNERQRAGSELDKHILIRQQAVDILPMFASTKYLARLVSFLDPQGVEIDNRNKRHGGNSTPTNMYCATANTA